MPTTTPNSNPTRADLLALQQRIVEKISEIEGHTPGNEIDGNAGAFTMELSRNEMMVATFYEGNDLRLYLAAAHPDTGKLADLRLHLAHVEDHMAALDEANQFWDTWAGRDPTEINEAPPPGPAGMQIHTARLMAAYGGE